MPSISPFLMNGEKCGQLFYHNACRVHHQTGAHRRRFLFFFAPSLIYIFFSCWTNEPWICQATSAQEPPYPTQVSTADHIAGIQKPPASIIIWVAMKTVVNKGRWWFRTLHIMNPEYNYSYIQITVAESGQHDKTGCQWTCSQDVDGIWVEVQLRKAACIAW